MKKRIISHILLILSISFIIYGILNSELDDILTKSIHICMECIGIG